MTKFNFLPTLVSIQNLRNALKSKDIIKNVRIIDANVGTAEKPAYDQAHVENAIFFDTMHCVTPSKWYPRDLPDRACFVDYAGSAGISNKHHLIVYDRSPFGFYAAPRVWWLFRYFGHNSISVLNGGYNKWVAEGGEVTANPTNLSKEAFEIKENKKLTRDFDQICKNIEEPKEIVLDARAPESFNGLDAVASPDVLVGHIKGSKNVPYGSLFDKETGLLKPVEELEKIFKAVSEQKANPLVMSCLTGMTASSLAFAAHISDYKNYSLYPGSWTEFSQRALPDQVEAAKPADQQ